MLIIRYRRVGKRNHAQFKIVVAEKSFPIKGKFVEALGSYDPHNKETVLKEDRIKYWLGIGAQCSDSVHNLFVTKGLIKGEKRKINIKEKAKEEASEEGKTEVKTEGEAEVKTEAPAEEQEQKVEEVTPDQPVKGAEEVKEEAKPEVAEEAKPEEKKEETK